MKYLLQAVEGDGPQHSKCQGNELHKMCPLARHDRRHLDITLHRSEDRLHVYKVRDSAPMRLSPASDAMLRAQAELAELHIQAGWD